MQISPNFLLQEFVPKAIYEKYGANSIWFVDPRIVKVAEFVRTFFGKPVTINNWHMGGQYNYSGYRDPECMEGAVLSQHRMGRAIDIKVSGITPQEVYKTILLNQTSFIQAGLTTLEDISATISWIHCDCRWIGPNQTQIKIVKP